MKKAVIGILAHVDSGKTTLSEAMLFASGAIRKQGRVDHKNAFLDTDSIERDRGITIFSKQALFEYGGTAFTLLDTPGHVDFSGETERVLSVIDAAVLVVSGVSGVQSHTRTLWRLLERYGVPTFIFINKTDMPGADKSAAMRDIEARLGACCADFSLPREELTESLSLCSEPLMEQLLDTGDISDELIKQAISERRVVPCLSGSALKSEGVERLLALLDRFITVPEPRESFGARVFKITTEESGARLTHMRITGGSLSVRDAVTYVSPCGEELTEKVSRIRIYHGEKFRSAETVSQGEVCAVLGLSACAAGQGLGDEESAQAPSLAPVLNYSVLPPEGVDTHRMLGIMRTLEAEDPTLTVGFSEQTGEITASLMGEVQLEVLSRILSERFGVEARFGEGRIAYRETIAEPVEGAGHFEPLRHYAEVHLRLEPLPLGSGLEFNSECSEDTLSRNWQRLILTHLRERVHKGVLTGSPITDMRITLTAGKAHLKHTEGGDFRQATYRAVRQGLRYAKSVLLEPYYGFRLEIPASATGRALTDLERLGAEIDPPETHQSLTVITGRAPVSKLRYYHTDVAGYTKGEGRLYCEAAGYGVCTEQEKAAADSGYDPDSDLANTADSVFCSHGAGHTVPWNEANALMHVGPEARKRSEQQAQELKSRADSFVRRAAEDEELMAIFERTYGTINRKKRDALHTPKEPPRQKQKPVALPKGPEYLLVDGYNIIFAWEELKRLADRSLDLARSELINRLCSYRGFRQCELILVFDAYRVKERERSVENISGISVVYTKEAETADSFIEKTAHDLSKQHRVRVATSDGLEQVIIMGDGALRVSASEFKSEVEQAERAVRDYIDSLGRQRL